MSPSLSQLIEIVLTLSAMDSWGIAGINAYRDVNFPGVDITRLRPAMLKKAAELAKAVQDERQ